MLSVFANWACLQDQYLSTPDFPLSPPQHQEQQVSAGLGLGREADLSESDPAASAVAPPALFADSAPAGTPLILTTSQWDRAFLASPELLRAESRARSGVRASVSALKAFITDDLQRNEHFSAKDHQQRSQHSRPHPHRQPVGQSRAGVAEKTEEDDVQFLREHIELRGFLPVSAIVEVSKENEH